jgi:hypothetical protein
MAMARSRQGMRYRVERGTDGKWYVLNSHSRKTRRPRRSGEYSPAARFDAEDEAVDLRDRLNALVLKSSLRP